MSFILEISIKTGVGGNRKTAFKKANDGAIWRSLSLRGKDFSSPPPKQVTTYTQWKWQRRVSGLLYNALTSGAGDWGNICLLLYNSMRSIRRTSNVSTSLPNLRPSPEQICSSLPFDHLLLFTSADLTSTMLYIFRAKNVLHPNVADISKRKA